MKRKVWLSICASFSMGTAAAVIEEPAEVRSLTVPYSADGAGSVGSGIDIDLVDQVRFTCVQFAPEDIRWLDGDGAVATEATVNLVTNYASLAKTLNLDVDYKSKADVSMAKLKAGASVDLSIKYEDFARDEERSLALVFKAQSDYGRQGLQPYQLQQEFNDLVAQGKFDVFRQRCGTHTQSSRCVEVRWSQWSSKSPNSPHPPSDRSTLCTRQMCQRQDLSRLSM